MIICSLRCRVVTMQWPGSTNLPSDSFTSLQQTVTREQANVEALTVKIQELEALKETASNELGRMVWPDSSRPVQSSNSGDKTFIINNINHN